MKRLRKLTGVLLISGFTMQSHATGIPCVDVLNVGANLQQIVLEVTGQAKGILLDQAQMSLQQKLTEYTGLNFSNATAEATARVTDAMAGVHNTVATIVNMPPVTSCVMYNESKNSRMAVSDFGEITKIQNNRFEDRNLNIGKSALAPVRKITANRQPIYTRIKNSLSNQERLLQVDSENFFRTGKYQNEETTTEEALARQDMLDMLSELEVNQKFDYRKDPEDFDENDMPAVMSYMKVLSRAAIARGAMNEVYALSSQSDSGVSINQMLASFNESRFLNPDWVMTNNNNKPGQELVQPEQVEREIANIQSYRAFVAEKAYRLQQWQAMIQATMLFMNLEE